MSSTEQETNADLHEEQPVDETSTDNTDTANIQKQIDEWEAEAKKLSEMQEIGDAATKSDADAAAAASLEVDSRSIYVGNVDYSTTTEELSELFSSCGKVNRVTIPADKFTGTPKGFAYIEFESADSVASALLLNETEFKQRPLKITSKRTNVPWFKQPNRGRGGRGGRGGFRGGRGGFMPVPMPYGYAPMPYPMFYAPRGGGARGGRGGARGTRGRHQPY